MEHWQRQRFEQNANFASGSRAFVTNNDPFVQYLVRWRLGEGLRRLARGTNGRITNGSNILVMCAGEGFEGSVLCDMGFTNVTVSDISEVGVAQAIERDKRLKGLVINAENANIDSNSFDVVVVQDGLHHLQSPIQGFTEMLRIARIGVLFLEPHDSLVGKIIGTKWEKNGDAINYVFRWKKKLVQDVSCSYLGHDQFQNLSFAFWHHSVWFHKLGKSLGGSAAVGVVRFIKFFLDIVLGRAGNQFCGLIIKH